MADKRDLLLLFDRPLEPIFVAKGERNAVFNVPPNYLTSRYKPLGTSLPSINEITGESIRVDELSNLPNLKEIQELGRMEQFSLFLPKHSYLAGKLISIFMGASDTTELLSVAVYVRDRINPYLFNYALSVAILHRPDTRDLDIPRLITCFPDKFIDGSVLVKLREEATLVPEESRIPIEIPVDYTASDLEPEHRIAYFREDVGINLHHWHWHLVYPFVAPANIVRKNRRGELFYYMHEQIVARYNCERLCNRLGRVRRYLNWHLPIEEGYFPKLNSTVASIGWPGRADYETLEDVDRESEQIKIDILDIIQWRDRIFHSIHTGTFIDDRGNRIKFTENEGIDVLGNMVEASILTPNRGFYGDIHNMGHVLISSVHDPDGRHLEPLGVMSDSSTAMRDPVFYRWHGFIDYVFQEHKTTLPRYTANQLDFAGVTVNSVIIQSALTDSHTINTFWQQSDIDISRGLDFQPHGPLLIRFTHLQHQPFTYFIIANNNGAARRGTCRIFISPKFDEKRSGWNLQEQRSMFIELDRFVVTLRRGVNVFTRNSKDSSVTIPFERTFRNLDDRPSGGDAAQQFTFCGCGWPEHMLIPKGTPEGYPCELFTMISDYEEDRVKQDTTGECNDAESYCGIRNGLYPDRRSMGYPFDRLPRPGVTTLQEFLTPNMQVEDVKIVFHDRVLRQRDSFPS